MNSGTRAKGNAFEDKACEYLSDIGYSIVARNYKPTRFSEVDIIAKDGECLVGIEVKGLTRETDAAFREDFLKAMISKNKIRKVSGSLGLYFQSSSEGCSELRVDVVLISGGKLFHYKNVST